MSKGSPIITLRVADADLLGKLDAAVQERKAKEPDYTATKFILAAVREKLAHMERSRKRKGV